MSLPLLAAVFKEWIWPKVSLLAQHAALFGIAGNKEVKKYTKMGEFSEGIQTVRISSCSPGCFYFVRGIYYLQIT